jgi:lipoyl(octanoyl) transferase
MSADLRVRWLGRMEFASALALQEELVAQKRDDNSLGDELLLLEHEPVYTIGRTPDQTSLRGAAHLPHPIFPINRGGQATYHGPGQLIGYPILDLRRCGQDLHRYLRWLEDLLIELLALHGIQAASRKGLTGVWVEDRKIASIGVGVRHWITMHGFALNVSGDLSPFDQITPCGITNVTMTSMERETGIGCDVETVASQGARITRKRFPDLLASARGSHADSGGSPEFSSASSVETKGVQSASRRLRQASRLRSPEPARASTSDHAAF